MCRGRWTHPSGPVCRPSTQPPACLAVYVLGCILQGTKTVSSHPPPRDHAPASVSPFVIHPAAAWAPASTCLAEAEEHVQSNPMGVSGLGPGRHLETAGEEGLRPGVNTCNRQELQLLGLEAQGWQSQLQAVQPRQTNTWGDLDWMARVVSLPGQVPPLGEGA